MQLEFSCPKVLMATHEAAEMRNETDMNFSDKITLVFLLVLKQKRLSAL